MIKYSKFPLTLYRIHATSFLLKEKAAQIKKGVSTYDFESVNLLYHPSQGSTYVKPNGFSLKPMGANFFQFFKSYKGRTKIIEFKEGTQLPSDMVLYQQQPNQYSLQTTKQIDPIQFGKNVDQFTKTFKEYNKEQFYQVFKTHGFQ